MADDASIYDITQIETHFDKPPIGTGVPVPGASVRTGDSPANAP